MRLDMGKVMLITGTSKGIGKRLRNYYLNRGFIVAGCSRSHVTMKHRNYSHFTLDIANEEEVVKVVKDVYEKFGRIDILINNAAIAAMNHILLTPYKKACEIFKTNFLGAFLFTREAAKIMVRRKEGRIVNFTTVAVPLKLEGESIYTSSKAALENFTQVAAKELGAFGITVNAVGPAPVKTDLIKNIPKKKIDSLLARQAVKRYCTFKDIINVLNFFISERSDFVTGQIIYLGGINA